MLEALQFILNVRRRNKYIYFDCSSRRQMMYIHLLIYTSVLPKVENVFKVDINGRI